MSSRKSFDVVLYGENSLDFVARLAPDSADGPTTGATASAAVAGKHSLAAFDLLPGGQAASAAIGCARQGLRVQYVGVFGDDAWAERVQQSLRRASVDVVALTVTGSPNRIAVVLVDPSGDRRIYERRDPQLRCVNPDRVIAAASAARVVLVDATDLATSVAAARAARAAGAVTVVDVDRVTAGTSDLLAHIDLIVAPEEFVQAFSQCTDLDAGLRAIAERFTPLAVIATQGARGSMALAGRTGQAGSDARIITTPAFGVPVVDTTGAGDAFRAGLCCAWVRQADASRVGNPDWEGILRWANATAALNCRAVGAQAGLPTSDEVAVLCNAGPAAPV